MFVSLETNQFAGSPWSSFVGSCKCLALGCYPTLFCWMIRCVLLPAQQTSHKYQSLQETDLCLVCRTVLHAKLWFNDGKSKICLLKHFSLCPNFYSSSSFSYRSHSFHFQYAVPPLLNQSTSLSLESTDLSYQPGAQTAAISVFLKSDDLALEEPEVMSLGIILSSAQCYDLTITPTEIVILDSSGKRWALWRRNILHCHNIIIGCVAKTVTWKSGVTLQCHGTHAV